MSHGRDHLLHGELAAVLWVSQSVGNALELPGTFGRERQSHRLPQHGVVRDGAKHLRDVALAAEEEGRIDLDRLLA